MAARRKRGPDPGGGQPLQLAPATDWMRGGKRGKKEEAGDVTEAQAEVAVGAPAGEDAATKVTTERLSSTVAEIEEAVGRLKGYLQKTQEGINYIKFRIQADGALHAMFEGIKERHAQMVEANRDKDEKDKEGITPTFLLLTMAMVEFLLQDDRVAQDRKELLAACWNEVVTKVEPERLEEHIRLTLEVALVKGLAQVEEVLSKSFSNKDKQE